MVRYCLRCGKTAEYEAEIKFCPHCGAPYEDNSEPGDSPGGDKPKPEAASQQPASDVEQKYIPWEDRARLGFLGSLFETWKTSVFYPVGFYRRMPVKGGIGNPLLYGLILAFIGFVFQMMYEQIFGQFFDPSRWYPFLDEAIDSGVGAMVDQMRSISTLAGIIIFPFAEIAIIFVLSGVFHLILAIFGWKAEDYEASFRIVAYSEGPSVFYIIPVIGGPVVVVWQIVLFVIGIREVHGTSTGKALLIVFLPLLLCCLCCCGIIFWFAGLAGLAG